VDTEWIGRFEVTEQEAFQWAQEELGAILDQLRAGIDKVLAEARRRVDERHREPVGQRTRLTADAGGALLALLGKLPGVIGNSLSGDAKRVAVARETLAGLDGRLRDAGIELDERFTSFADRLAGLHDEARPRT
jgi:hypothetical protein